MNDIRIIAVVLAFLAFLLAYGSVTFAGDRWKWTGGAGALAAMLLVSWLAVCPVTVEHRTPQVEHRTANVEHGTTMFVASSIQKEGKKAYHVPACYYAKRIAHPVDFDSESQAVAAGYRPCSECITPRLAGLK